MTDAELINLIRPLVKEADIAALYSLIEKNTPQILNAGVFECFYQEASIPVLHSIQPLLSVKIVENGQGKIRNIREKKISESRKVRQIQFENAKIIDLQDQLAKALECEIEKVGGIEAAVYADLIRLKEGDCFVSLSTLQGKSKDQKRNLESLKRALEILEEERSELQKACVVKAQLLKDAEAQFEAKKLQKEASLQALQAQNVFLEKILALHLQPPPKKPIEDPKSPEMLEIEEAIDERGRYLKQGLEAARNTHPVSGQDLLIASSAAQRGLPEQAVSPVQALDGYTQGSEPSPTSPPPRGRGNTDSLFKSALLPAQTSPRCVAELASANLLQTENRYNKKPKPKAPSALPAGAAKPDSTLSASSKPGISKASGDSLAGMAKAPPDSSVAMAGAGSSVVTEAAILPLSDYARVNVDAQGNCLIHAVLIGFLGPILHDTEQFDARAKKFFNSDVGDALGGYVTIIRDYVMQLLGVNNSGLPDSTRAMNHLINKFIRPALHAHYQACFADKLEALGKEHGLELEKLFADESEVSSILKPFYWLGLGALCVIAHKLGVEIHYYMQPLGTVEPMVIKLGVDCPSIISVVYCACNIQEPSGEWKAGERADLDAVGVGFNHYDLLVPNSDLTRWKECAKRQRASRTLAALLPQSEAQCFTAPFPVFSAYQAELYLLAPGLQAICELYYFQHESSRCFLVGSRAQLNRFFTPPLTDIDLLFLDCVPEGADPSKHLSEVTGRLNVIFCAAGGTSLFSEPPVSPSNGRYIWNSFPVEYGYGRKLDITIQCLCNKLSMEQFIELSLRERIVSNKAVALDLTTGVHYSFRSLSAPDEITLLKAPAAMTPNNYGYALACFCLRDMRLSVGHSVSDFFSLQYLQAIASQLRVPDRVTCDEIVDVATKIVAQKMCPVDPDSAYLQAGMLVLWQRGVIFNIFENSTPGSG